MKVARWKVLGIAGALAVGFVATSEAAQIKVSDETWANFGLNMKIWYKNLDKRSNSTTDGGWSKNEFSVGQAKIYFTGQVNNLFQFYGEFDQERSADQIGEAGINLAFAKEFQVLAGKIRKPFTRDQIVSGYALLVPSDSFSDPQGILGRGKLGLDRTDQGLVFHGDLAGGILNYRIGVFNEDRAAGSKVWTGTGATGWAGTQGTGKLNDKKNFEWNARVEFQPLMLGFKPDSAATITAKSADTTLGAKDIFVIGLGYHKEKHTPKLTQLNNKDLDRTGWTIDATFEKKFGNLVPNLQLGYIALDETHGYYKYDASGVSTPKKGDTDIWYVQGQLLYDQVVGLGKPALAIRYEKTEADGEYYNSTTTPVHKKGLDIERWGVAFNYYLKGQAARISLGFDNVKYKGAASAWLKGSGNPTPAIKKEDSITDWYLYLQSQF